VNRTRLVTQFTIILPNCF